jgi:DNA primase
LLWRVVPVPALCFDGDKAGIKAAWRAAEMAFPLLSPGHSLGFVFLPDGMDPDDVLRLKGSDALRHALQSPKPLLDAVWERALAENDRSTPERSAKMETDLLKLVDSIGDGAVRSHDRQAIKDRVRDLLRAPRDMRTLRLQNGIWRSGASAATLMAAVASLQASSEELRQLREEGCYDNDVMN